jgi:hypothetical protein
MDTHVKALGIINIVFGALSAIFGISTVAGFGGISPLLSAAYTDFAFAALLASAFFHTVVAIPCIVLGWLVMRYSDTAKSLLIIVSALNLLNMPLGPLVGGYGLWVLLTPETDPLFLNAPRRPGSRQPARKKRALQAKEALKVKGTSILRSRGADAGPQ